MEKITGFLANFGNSLGLKTFVDDAGNVIIRKPATPGMENRKELSSGTYGYGSAEKITIRFTILRKIRSKLI